MEVSVGVKVRERESERDRGERRWRNGDSFQDLNLHVSGVM